MTNRGRVVGRAALGAVLLTLALPAAQAWAHAALLHTSPSASGTVDGSPAHVALTYSEAVEPKFAVVSVTDASGRRQTAAGPSRSKTNPNQLVVPLRHLTRGWYLVFWRVISVDGHPVRGAFTFAVGPNPGPAPQFAIPSLRETAATPGLLALRWIMFVAMMAGVGLLAFRFAVARPVVRRVPGVSLRPVSIVLGIAAVVALLVVPVYLDVATAQFSERSALDLGNLLPLMRVSAFGRSLLDLELVLALGTVAGAAALVLDEPGRERRSVAELLAIIGVVLAAGAALLVPGLAGHAAQYSPRGLSLPLDWLHLASGSLWIGGLIGLTVLAASTGARRAASMVVVVPRFSRLAFGSVLLLIASGTAATVVRLPTLRSLWETGYGQALLVKIGVLLVALGLAGVNLLRTRPRLEASRQRPGLAAPAVTLLRRLVGGEVALGVTAIFVAGVLSSLAPPPKALGQIGEAAASVGPGSVTRTISHGPYRLTVQITPNRAAVPNAFLVKVTKDGKPVQGAEIVADFTMLDMEMGRQAYRLAPQSPGTYGKRSVPSLVMVGRWGLAYTVTIPGQAPFQVVLIDHAEG